MTAWHTEHGFEFNVLLRPWQGVGRPPNDATFIEASRSLGLSQRCICMI
jgi:hypothetical protein